MDDRYGLDRFVVAQDVDGTFQRAVAELQTGVKVTHWMWFVFPQVAGLASSATSRKFAINSLDEAKAYLRHPVLGARLVRCAQIVAAADTTSAVALFGWTDAQKLQSSMTLFMRAAPSEPAFQLVLDRFFEGLPDGTTDRLLSAV